MSRFWSTVLAVTLVTSVVMSFVGPSKEAKFLWDVKAFFAVYGFVGCVAIIFVSKWLGRFWLQRGEDYYDPHQAPAEAGDAGESGESGAADDAGAPAASEGPGSGEGPQGSAHGGEARGGGRNDHA
jgi:hypothetical protein